MMNLKVVMLNSLLLLCVFALLLPSISFAEKEKTTIKLSPKIKIQDRDPRWFARLPCNQLQNVKANSKKEQALLAQRKQQCVNGFSAFY